MKYVIVAVSTFLALAPLAAAQHERPEPGAPTTVIAGRVCTPEGRPAQGAIVVSSAGGRTVTGPDGSYSLAFDLPLDANLVHVIAMQAAGAAKIVGDAEVHLSNPGGTNAAGVLRLGQGSSCPPSWIPTFGNGSSMNWITAVALFDDGNGEGPTIHVGGGTRIGRRNGASWTSLGSLAGGATVDVRALLPFDDGSGPALYAGGTFTSVDDVSANRVARWDGASWSPLGSGMGNGSVSALAVFDDGTGPALYAGGTFVTADGTTVNKVARWDGSSWSALGSGITGPQSEVDALAVFDDGSGPRLYAGGRFTDAGGVAVSKIASWDGTSWATLGGGIGVAQPAGSVKTLVAFDDGSGPALYAGGGFNEAGGIAVANIARWNGSSWAALGSGLSGGSVRSLLAFDDGGGPALYAGGAFESSGAVAANHIARWDGAIWSQVGGGTNEAVSELLVHDSELVAFGQFQEAGGLLVNAIARWNGTSWARLERGIGGPVEALTVFDDGAGPALFAGGIFGDADGLTLNRIGKWDGTSWSALGSGLSGGYIGVKALSVFDDGSGPALYAGGGFTTAGGAAASQIARWDGASWSALGSGLSFIALFTAVDALAVFDDGSGPALYAGGHFATAGGVTVNNIARWDGSSWSALGSGVAISGQRAHVRALQVFDDGSGPALYVGGDFTTAGGVTVNGIARWDGSSWSSLGGGLVNGGSNDDESVNALAIFDDGSGPALHAGGSFASKDSIARWDGASWTSLGSGVAGFLESLLVFDDGSGSAPALYAGGSFSSVGGVAAIGIARWNGTVWSPLESGTQNDQVDALAVFDDGSGGAPGLYVGGGFFSAFGERDDYLALWKTGPDETPPLLSCPSQVIVREASDGPPGRVVHFTVTATDTCDPSPSIVCDPPSGSFFPRGTTLVTCTATDASGNESVHEFPVTVQYRATSARKP